MSPVAPHIDTYARGKALSERVDPGMEDALQARYDALVPGMARTVVDVAYGQFHARSAVDEKTRLLAAIAALTALGGQTLPQLKVNIAAARSIGMRRAEICEIIFQMAIYGGFPAMLNALNAALEVFEAEAKSNGADQPETAVAPEPEPENGPKKANLPKFMTRPMMGEQ